MKTRRLQSILNLALALGLLLVLNVAANFVRFDLDLTEDKRFTLTDATYQLIGSVDDVVSIEVYLEGDFPATFQHLKSAVQEMLEKFRGQNALIEFSFTNPLEGSDEENKKTLERFQRQKIVPVNLTVTSRGARDVRLVFPYAMIRYRGQERVVNLLETTGGVNQDFTQMDNINRSINLLEYKFANAIQKIQLTSRPRVALLGGHGELERPFTESLEEALYEYYDIARLDLDSAYRVDTMIDVLIIAKPRAPFGDKHKFMIDQYILNGGKVIWLLDMLIAEADSLGGRGEFIPGERPLDIGSMLVDYGVRVNANLVLDWEASSIPMQVGNVGGKPQLELRKWFYHPRVFPYCTPLEAKNTGASTIQHPIVKNLDFVDMRFPSSLDTVATKSQVTKTPLLRSSRHSKVQYPPVLITTKIIDAGIPQDAFNKGYQTVAMLLEGTFYSHYRNRISPEMQAGFAKAGWEILEKSKVPGKMIVVGDGDVAANAVMVSQGLRVLPLGLNKYEGYTYGNRDFLMNCVEYMLDTKGIIAARNKEIKLRPLDQERAFEQETMWQSINLLAPLAVLAVFGGVYTWRRRRAYGR